MTATLPPRERWMRALTAVERERVLTTAEAICAELDGQVTYLQPPQAGLAMLRMREPCLGDHYHLGELPLTVSVIELRTASGTCWQGAAQVLIDDVGLATALAIADAVLANHPASAPALVDLLREGDTRCHDEDRSRATMWQRTTVDFDLLEAAEDPEDLP